MDMDQRTRILSSGHRVIVLGDGTEITTLPNFNRNDDGDIDMDDRGEAEEAEDDEQVPRGSQAGSKENGTRSERESTPEPSAAAKSDSVEPTPAEPKMSAATDSADTKLLAEQAQAQQKK